jgi:hypothetical protein
MFDFEYEFSVQVSPISVGNIGQSGREADRSLDEKAREEVTVAEAFGFT